ncbi:MAG: hypothetical protein QOH71_4594 [Blastocatellia bacterium]|jgi:hypothetical protein|nr:hypothetical protein [Blastocatellia bacterium]
MLRGHRDLKVYQLAYKLAMEIFHLSKAFPREEIYSLTDQIRRSSRSVAANLAEGFRKRRYPNMLVNKLLIAMLKQPRLRSGSILPLIVVICQLKTTLV